MSLKKPKLLDQVREKVRLRNYAFRTEQSYVAWVKRYILFHDKKHPSEMGKQEAEAFLTHLAVKRDVAASTQNQALSALLFLYSEVLEQPLGYVDVIEYPSAETDWQWQFVFPSTTLSKNPRGEDETLYR